MFTTFGSSKVSLLLPSSVTSDGISKYGNTSFKICATTGAATLDPLLFVPLGLYNVTRTPTYELPVRAIAAH